jgi:hypothetical protein
VAPYRVVVLIFSGPLLVCLRYRLEFSIHFSYDKRVIIIDVATVT